MRLTAVHSSSHDCTFSSQRGPAPFGDVVVAALAAGLLLLPFADDQPARLQLVQARVERPLAPGERPVRVAVDGRGDLVAVHRLAAEQRQDQQRQRAFEEFGVHDRPQTKEFDTSDIYVLPEPTTVVKHRRETTLSHLGSEAAMMWCNPSVFCSAGQPIYGQRPKVADQDPRPHDCRRTHRAERTDRRHGPCRSATRSRTGEPGAK